MILVYFSLDTGWHYGHSLQAIAKDATRAHQTVGRRINFCLFRSTKH
jgi:hypothetical protein